VPRWLLLRNNEADRDGGERTPINLSGAKIAVRFFRKAAFKVTSDVDKMQMQRRLDMQVEQYWMIKKARSTNPLVHCGTKYFSQNDEDGILLEILKRLGIQRGIALELGVGNGLENNSLILLMLGWRVLWFGGEELSISLPSNCENLRFAKEWITRENCAPIVANGLASVGTEKPDVIGIDLDGNDVYIVEALIEAGYRPSVFIVEYNGKFPPPIKWRIKYDPSYHWDFSDYQGASLQEFVDVMSGVDYRLVCCNITGTNAFFVPADHLDKFMDVPSNVSELFFPADYNWFFQRGHRVSPKTIERFLK
jgi:hypothetical protein